jgi:hypothetical protein
MNDAVRGLVRAESAYPSLSFRARLVAVPDAAGGSPAAKVGRFPDEHPGCDLRSTYVEPFLLDYGLRGDAELRAAVLGT